MALIPTPNHRDLVRSQSLSCSIQQEIDREGSISFSRFMELALYHPQFGYYHADTIEIGKRGDFTTAPEISPLFGQCIARQIAQIHLHLKQLDLLELGAGTGKLAGDLLLELQKLNCLPIHYYIYEISTVLRNKQQQHLKKILPDYYSRIIWLDALPTTFTGIILANEVLDALPVHRFLIDQHQCYELSVMGKNEKFDWLPTSASDVLLAKINYLAQRYQLQPGYISEINLQLKHLIKTLASALTQGVMLLLDYGYGQQEYYHPQRNRGTLTCFYQHKINNNPFDLPGLQDITAHVDFTEVIEIASDHGCTLNGFTTQAAFLLNCGLTQIAAEISGQLNREDEFRLHQAIKTLTLPTEMGEVVKVMALGKNFDQDLLGFCLHDRRRLL